MSEINHDRRKVDRAALVAALRAALPADAVLDRPEQLRPYECDGLSAYRQLPLAVALPADTDQVAAALAVCREHGAPVVARGSGTSLSGGALPHPDGVVLSLAKLNRILAIDPANRTARVQPGVRNLAISEAAKPHGLYYAPDPSSQIACSIGGNLAVEMLTIDGELLTLGGDALDTPGYDLLALVIGSEGMLGVVTEITVKLLPLPSCARVVLGAFASIPAAGDAVSRIIAAGITPGGLEMMDGPAIQAAEDFVHAGYPTDAAAILLCELDGTVEEVDAQIDQVRTLMEACGASEVRVAQDEAERAAFWSGRKNAFPAVGRVAPDYYCMDGTIPRRHLARVLEGITALSEEYGLPVANVFHAGDGNLHPLILYDANNPGELERTEEFGARILELCVEVGGTITGEHGVGMEKINQMCVQFSAAEIEQFHAVKAALDPERLLNPGKAIPSSARCSELGGMHVHGGQLPFPDIERF